MLGSLPPLEMTAAVYHELGHLAAGHPLACYGPDGTASGRKTVLSKRLARRVPAASPITMEREARLREDYAMTAGALGPIMPRRRVPRTIVLSGVGAHQLEIAAVFALACVTLLSYRLIRPNSRPGAILVFSLLCALVSLCFASTAYLDGDCPRAQVIGSALVGARSVHRMVRLVAQAGGAPLGC